tara:strand:+ start:105 stop:311 length:207 start_codon:yes stop_codon:yes gene_type:complete
MTLSAKTKKEDKGKKIIFTEIYKKVPPVRLTFKSLYLMYKEMYDKGKLVENGAAHQRMKTFRSKIITN